MPAIQPIPRNVPDSSAREADALLALHNRSSDGRVRPARWNAAGSRAGSVQGENSGTPVAGTP